MQTIILALIPSLIVLLGGILAFWKTWGAINERINGWGKRVNDLENDESADREALSQLKQAQVRNTEMHTHLHERLGKLEKSVEHTDELINGMRFEVIQKINDLQRDVVSGQGKIRERIVKLEVITQIENKLGRDLNELFGSEE